MFKCRVLDNILSGISENKIQQNEVVLYFFECGNQIF